MLFCNNILLVFLINLFSYQLIATFRWNAKVDGAFHSMIHTSFEEQRLNDYKAHGIAHPPGDFPKLRTEYQSMVKPCSLVLKKSMFPSPFSILTIWVERCSTTFPYLSVFPVSIPVVQKSIENCKLCNKTMRGGTMNSLSAKEKDKARMMAFSVYKIYVSHRFSILGCDVNFSKLLVRLY